LTDRSPNGRRQSHVASANGGLATTWKRPPRQRSPSQIGLHHADQRFGGEPAPKPGSQRSVELNRDDLGPGTGTPSRLFP
jgi:hypothetical protein